MGLGRLRSPGLGALGGPAQFPRIPPGNWSGSVSEAENGLVGVGSQAGRGWGRLGSRGGVRQENIERQDLDKFERSKGAAPGDEHRGR